MKVVLITGGSGGIGAAVSRLAARQGWCVYFTYRSGNARALEIAEELHSYGARSLPMNLEDPSSISDGLDYIAKDAGRLDALILSASPAPLVNSFLKENSEALLSQFKINVIASQQLIAESWKRFFRENGAGHVVALLSAAIEPPPAAQMSSYVVAKRGLGALLECALVELGGGGLRACAILPTYTDTPMLTAFNHHLYEMARLKQPGGQFQKPEVVADQVLRCMQNPPPAGELHYQTVVPLNSTR